jgi:hypothetical protein
MNENLKNLLTGMLMAAVVCLGPLVAIIVNNNGGLPV